MNEKTWWRPILHFAGHTFIGTVLFCIVAMPAVGLNLFVTWLETLHVTEFIIQVLTFLETAILLVDGLLFLVYLGVTAKRAIKEMLDDESAE